MVIKIIFFCCYLTIVKHLVVCKNARVRNFPKGFKFGASSSAFQVEGAWNEGGKGLSNWDIATHRDLSTIKDGGVAEVAADSYHQYPRDIEIINFLGLNFYKFSVSWTRIYPNGFPDRVNQAGVEYYNDLINRLVKSKVEPFLTMFHWDMPWSLQVLGGWANSASIDWFVDYAKVLFDKFGDRVKHWVTVNDPKQICFDGYGADSEPAANTRGISLYLCAKNILLAHAKVYHLYDEKYRKLQNGTIGIAIGLNWFEPASETVDDYQAAADARQFEWGQFANPIFSRAGDFPNELRMNVAMKSAEQGYPRSRLPELSALEVAFIRGSADFLGVISYTTKLAYRDASLEGLYPVPSYKDDMGAVLVKDPLWTQSSTASWQQDVSWGFFKVLMEVKNLYQNPPVYVLENGWATDRGLLDDDRITYLRNYLNELIDSLEEGCDVKGYAVRSLIDGFEWLNGYKQKFGLYEVDFSSVERNRTPRKSAFVYKEIVKSKVIDPYYEPENNSFGAEKSNEQSSE